eukprot:1918431-Rhodomonas_salina.1
MAATSRGAETAEEDCLRAGDEVQAKNEEEQKYRIKEIELVALRLSVGGFTTADDLDFLEAENVEKLDVLERDKNALKRMIRELNNTNEAACHSILWTALRYLRPLPALWVQPQYIPEQSLVWCSVGFGAGLAPGIP